MIRPWRYFAPIAVLALVLTACPAGDGGEDGEPPAPGETPAAGETPGDGTAVECPSEGTVTVTSLWGGAEETAFRAVLDAFTEETGITAQYDPQRQDYAAVLRSRIEGGNPPDVAIIPGIGFLRTFAATADLIPLSELGINRADIEDRYAPGILDVGTVDGELFAIMVKYNSKTTYWYRPDVFSDVGVETPGSWEELQELQQQLNEEGITPQALGAQDSWTLTDWFENIYLRQAGTEMYDQLFSGELPFTDESVVQAIERMREVLTDETVVGGIDTALATGFVDAIGLVFQPDPQAATYYEGGFVGGIAMGQVNEDLVPGETIDWFDFPTIEGEGEGRVVIGGDVIAALQNRPEIGCFIQYMTTVEAGQTWAEQGTIVSPIVEVDTSVYPNELIQREAEQVANASDVRFDGSDLLPGGPDLGAVLQSALRGEEVGPLLENFESEVANAWATERGE